MHTVANPLICALDTPDLAATLALARSLHGSVGAVKLGLEFFVANGPLGVEAVQKACGLPIFLDLKFHDIPNTVAGAVRSACALDVFMLTVHAGGGLDMMRAAKDAAQETAVKLGKKPPLVVAVTVLTSMDENDLAGIGINHPVDEQVKKLGLLACEAGVDGVVCSPHEIKLLKEQCGQEFITVVPGIRPEGSALGDQKRVLSPRQAREQGADYLVVGRPITGASEPARAAREMAESL